MSKSAICLGGFARRGAFRAIWPGAGRTFEISTGTLVAAGAVASPLLRVSLMELLPCDVDAFGCAITHRTGFAGFFGVGGVAKGGAPPLAVGLRRGSEPGLRRSEQVRLRHHLLRSGPKYLRCAQQRSAPTGMRRSRQRSQQSSRRRAPWSR